MRTHRLMLFCFGIALTLAMYSTVQAANPYNLATGARGQLCLTCHEDFKQTMSKKFIHTPLAQGDCSGCHNPHAADHGMLLAADDTQICFSCHDGLVPPEAQSSHEIVSRG